VKIYVAAVEVLRKKGKKRKKGMKLSLPPKLVEKLVWVPVYKFINPTRVVKVNGQTFILSTM
jgi:hypothetical protein